MRNIRHILLLLILCVSFVVASPQPQKTPGFWTRVLRLLGVTATPAAQKGDEDPTTEGDIWLYKVETRRVGSPLKQGNFRSAIFMPSGQTILAMSGTKLVKFDFAINGVEVTTTEPVELWTKPEIVKLISVQSDGAEVLVLTDLDNDNCPGVGVLKLSDGSINALPHNNSQEDRDLVTYLRRSEREYDDGTKLEVRIMKKTKNGAQVESIDSFMQLPRQDWVNVSQCRPGMNCGQPAISPDRKFVLFIGKA